jgi:hypothetical protein
MIFMTTLELKNIIINEINSMSDISFLHTIQSLIEAKSEKKLIYFTPGQKEEITTSQKEISRGLHIDHNDLDKEVNEWLNAR